MCLVELDAPSLENLPERYLADCIENEEIPVAYYFTDDDLEPAVRRDTDAEREQAQENPFKHLSRNQVITVQYTDGSIRIGKFKRLEADMRAGKCSLVK